MSYKENRRLLPSDREMRKVQYQIKINNFFFKIIQDLGNEIIDSANEFTHNRYGKYPTFQAIRQARKIMNEIGEILGIDDLWVM